MPLKKQNFQSICDAMEIPHIGECFDRCGAKKNNDNSLKMIPAIKSPCFSDVPYRKKRRI